MRVLTSLPQTLRGRQSFLLLVLTPTRSKVGATRPRRTFESSNAYCCLKTTPGTLPMYFNLHAYMRFWLAFHGSRCRLFPRSRRMPKVSSLNRSPEYFDVTLQAWQGHRPCTHQAVGSGKEEHGLLSLCTCSSLHSCRSSSCLPSLVTCRRVTTVA